MGVTGFFSWVEKHHPGMTKAPHTVKEYVDHFMIDYNALIYQVLNWIRFDQNLTPDSKNWTEDQWESYLIEQVVQYTSDLISWVNPRKRAVIAIDGPAPRAKLEQQRNRRFKTTWTGIWEPKVTSEQPVNDVKFSTSRITVGTSFWGRCVDALALGARQGRLSPMSGRHNGIIPLVGNVGHETYEFAVELWDAQNHGEGEHKIIQSLLADAKTICNDHVLIYGLDADLLMLTLRMTLIYSKISILRENTNQREDNEISVSRLPKWNTPFFWVDMLTFRKSWFARIMEISQEVNKVQVNWPVQTLVADAMVLYCFLGNDFLRCQVSLEIYEGGIDYLWKAYARTRYRMRGTPMVNLPEGTMNREFLFNLVKNLAYNEIHQAKWLQNRRRTTARVQGSKSVQQLWNQIWANESLRSCFEWTDWTHPQAVEQYHQHNFHWSPTSLQPSFVRSSTGQRVCRDYLRGLDFVLQYYWNERPDWEFYYAWDASPLFQDLVEYMQLQGMEQPKRLQQFRHGSQSSIVPLFQGFWVFHSSQRKHLDGDVKTLMTTRHWESPERFTMAGSDTYHMFHLEPKLPPISWNFWRAQWPNDKTGGLWDFHPVRRWRMQVRT